MHLYSETTREYCSMLIPRTARRCKTLSTSLRPFNIRNSIRILTALAIGVWLAVAAGCTTSGPSQTNSGVQRNATGQPASNTNSQANANAAKAATAGTPARATGGTIEIKSTPPGASIVLVSEDEAGAGPPKPYGSTPATLTGIAPGKYTV